MTLQLAGRTTRRRLLRGASSALARGIGFPMLNFASFQVFAGDSRHSAARAAELIERSLVIDMLAPLALYKSSCAFRDKLDTDGFDHPRKIFDLTEALIRRGDGDTDIAAVPGGNFRRLLASIRA